MTDYILKIRKDNLFYCNVILKADFKEEAIKQSNEIMDRFPEREFTGEVHENDNVNTPRIIAWFN